MTFATPIFMKPTVAPWNCVLVSCIETKSRQEVLIVIHLRPWVNSGSDRADFHETRSARRHFNINSIQIFIKPRQTIFTVHGLSRTNGWHLHIRISAFLLCKELLIMKCIVWYRVVCQCRRGGGDWYFNRSLQFTYHWKLLLPFSWFFIKLWLYPHYYMDRNFRPLRWSTNVCSSYNVVKKVLELLVVAC